MGVFIWILVYLCAILFMPVSLPLVIIFNIVIALEKRRNENLQQNIKEAVAKAINER